MKIGMIGLGIMGKPMAKNLLKAGYEVWVNNRTRAPMDELAGSTVMNAKAPMMIAGDDKPGFKIDLHIKDLNNALDCAHTVGAPVPMTAQVQGILQWLHTHEGGQKDHSAIAQYYEYLADIKIGR